jgi:hypothetical protein
MTPPAIAAKLGRLASDPAATYNDLTTGIATAIVVNGLV